jgi:hypothetical protein
MTIEQYGTIFAGLIEGQIVLTVRMVLTDDKSIKERAKAGLDRVLAAIETLREAEVNIESPKPTPELPRIPVLAECRLDPIEVATPKDRLDTDTETEARIRNAAHGMYVCWHPDADDQFNVSGIGHSKSEAYRNMLDDLYERQCDQMTDQECDRWDTRIRLAKEAA